MTEKALSTHSQCLGTTRDPGLAPRYAREMNVRTKGSGPRRWELLGARVGPTDPRDDAMLVVSRGGVVAVKNGMHAFKGRGKILLNPWPRVLTD